MQKNYYKITNKVYSVKNIKHTLMFIYFFSNCIFGNGSDSLSYYEKFNLAVQFYQDGRYKIAKERFSSILTNEQGNQNPAAELMIAKSQYQLGYLDTAIISSKSILSVYPNSPYENDALILIGDIALTKSNATKAYRFYLNARSVTKELTSLRIIDNRIYHCIGIGLKENTIESLLFREKNPSNREIINITRSYQAWKNGDYFTMQQILNEIDENYMPEYFNNFYNRLRGIKKDDVLKTVTFAVLLPLKGQEQEKGLSYLLGLTQYLDSLDKPKSLRYLVYDTAGKVDNTLNFINNIIIDAKIIAVLGPITKDEVLSISGLKTNIPFLIPKSELSGLSNISNNLFFLSPSTEIIAHRTAQMIIKEFKFKNIAVLSPGNGAEKLLTDYFLNECYQLGVDPVIIEWYIEKPENLSRQLKNMRDIAWQLLPGEKPENKSLDLKIDSLDALFDVDVTDFFELPPEKEDEMDKKDSAKIFLETIEAIYMPIRPGELTYIGTQFPFYNLNTSLFVNDNWLDMSILNQEVIGPHVEDMRIITDVNFEENNLYQDPFFNYYSLAIDHTHFIHSITDNGILKRKHFFDKLLKNNGFNGDHISIGFQGKNNNENGIVQVLQYSNKKVKKIGVYDGTSFIKNDK